VENIIFYDGEFLKESEVSISPFSRGLHYGDGVFETMRSYTGKVFRFEDHIKRLIDGLEVLRIQPIWDTIGLSKAVDKVLNQNRLSDASIKIIAFRQGGEGPTPAPNSKASVLISARPFDFKKKQRFEEGISAHVASIRRNTHSPVSAIKSLNYLDNILGRLDSYDNNSDEALFLNIHNKVAEGATSNIFIIKQGAVYTPPSNAGILKGITRDVVMQITKEAGITCSENDLFLDEVFDADEAFLTNSLMEIMPLVSLNRMIIGKGTPGNITKQLMFKYHSLVKKELNENFNRPIL
jgi:branched-chain amino acid aminotransferase